MSKVYLVGVGTLLKNGFYKFLKVFSNLDKAINFAVDEVYERTDRRYPKTLIRNHFDFAISKYPDRSFWWYVEYINDDMDRDDYIGIVEVEMDE